MNKNDMKRSESEFQLPTMGFRPSFTIFGVASLAMILGTRFLIPFLIDATDMESVLSWFIVAGVGIFLPLLFTAAFILKKEGILSQSGIWGSRLRFNKMNTGDWFWSIGGILVIGVIGGGMMKVIEAFLGQVELQPSFISFEPLTSGRYWILAIWFPYWILNIMGEEILWRGAILPRQEVAFGKSAWFIQGLGWLLFHVAFGWQILLLGLPLLFILPYIVQRRQNTWIGVIIHAGMNGPAFLAISFGLM